MAFDPKDKDTRVALKAAAEEAVDSAISPLNESIEKLEKKNFDLVGRLKKANKNAEIDPADHAALQAELDESETKLSKAVKELKSVTTESDKTKKKLETESKVSHDLLVGTGLSNALLESGVKNSALLEAAQALFANQVTLEVDGDKRVAKIGDELLADHIKKWAGSDKGKPFVDAPNNNGGGANGGAAGNSTSKTMTRTAHDAMDPKGKMEFAKEGGTVTADA